LDKSLAAINEFMSVTLAIDAMGGDHGVVVTVPAACDFLEKHADVKIILVGDPDLIRQVLSKSPKAPMERIQIIPPVKLS
jgi:glycerol-3-phosphate acyltransferase PlsX